MARKAASVRFGARMCSTLRAMARTLCELASPGSHVARGTRVLLVMGVPSPVAFGRPHTHESAASVVARAASESSQSLFDGPSCSDSHCGTPRVTDALSLRLHDQRHSDEGKGVRTSSLRLPFLVLPEVSGASGGPTRKVRPRRPARSGAGGGGAGRPTTRATPPPNQPGRIRGFARTALHRPQPAMGDPARWPAEKPFAVQARPDAASADLRHGGRLHGASVVTVDSDGGDQPCRRRI